MLGKYHLHTISFVLIFPDFIDCKEERRRRSDCPSKATGLTASEQAAVLAAHNDARANAFPVPLPALTPMTWDDDVASVAQTHSDQCM